MQAETEKLTGQDYPRLPPKLKVLITDARLGKGSEGVVHAGYEHTPEGPTGERLAIKTRNTDLVGILSILFRFRIDIWHRCMDAYKSADMPCIPAEFHEKLVILDGYTGERHVENKVQTSPCIENIATNTVDYGMMTDLEIGQQIITEVANILIKAHSMAKNTNIGLDSFGIETIMRILEAIPNAVLLQIIDQLPEDLRAKIRPLVQTKPIMINNLVRFSETKEQEKVVTLIDIGGLELDDPIYGPLLNLLYELGTAGLTETVLTANRDLAEQLGRAPDSYVVEQLEAIKKEKHAARPYQIISETMMKVLTPYLKKSAEDKRKNANTQQPGTFLQRVRARIMGVVPTPTS